MARIVRGKLAQTVRTGAGDEQTVPPVDAVTENDDGVRAWPDGAACSCGGGYYLRDQPREPVRRG